jgi:hypothetical protein
MIMTSADSEGLGLSVLAYLGAIFGALALLGMPVYYATRGEIHENPPLAQSDPLLNGPLTTDRASGRFPLAMLQKQVLAEAETAKVLTPKSKKAEHAERSTPRTPRRDNGTPVAQLQTERARIFPFSLF